MEKNIINILTFIIAVIVGFQSLVEFIQNFLNGIVNLLDNLSPAIRLILIILIFHMLLKKK